MKNKLAFLLLLPFLIDVMSGCTEKCPPTQDVNFNYCGVDMKTLQLDHSDPYAPIDSIGIAQLGIEIEFLTDIRAVCSVSGSSYALNPMMALSCINNRFYPSLRVDSLSITTVYEMSSEYPAGSLINELLEPWVNSTIVQAIQPLQEPPFETEESLVIHLQFKSSVLDDPGLHRFVTLVYLSNGEVIEDAVEIPYLY